MSSSLQFVGFWNRFTAFVLDLLILGLPFAVLVMPTLVSLVFSDEEMKAVLAASDARNLNKVYSIIVELSIVFCLCWAAILAVFCASKWQATPGKRIMNCYVADSQGEKPKFSQLLFRFAALPFAVLTLQTPERYYIYKNLEQLGDTKITANAEYAQIFTTPISETISLATFILICVWYLLIVFRKDKAALHDVLFSTKVVYGRP